MTLKIDKELQPLAKRIRAAGYSIVAGGKHLKIKNSEGKTVGQLPSSPSDGARAKKNVMTQLRRRGILQ